MNSDRYMVSVNMQYSYVTYPKDMSTAYLTILLNHVICLDQPHCNRFVRNKTNNIYLQKLFLSNETMLVCDHSSCLMLSENIYQFTRKD